MKKELEKALQEFDDKNGDNLFCEYREDWRAVIIYDRHTLEKVAELNDTALISQGGHFTLTRQTMILLSFIMDNL